MLTEITTLPAVARNDGFEDTRLACADRVAFVCVGRSGKAERAALQVEGAQYRVGHFKAGESSPRVLLFDEHILHDEAGTFLEERETRIGFFRAPHIPLNEERTNGEFGGDEGVVLVALEQVGIAGAFARDEGDGTVTVDHPCRGGCGGEGQAAGSFHHRVGEGDDGGGVVEAEVVVIGFEDGRARPWNLRIGHIGGNVAFEQVIGS